MKTKTQKSFTHVIRTTFPFDQLTQEQFDLLMVKAKRKSFKKNQFLFHEEDEDPEIYFLLKGLAKNMLHKDNGQQISVRFYYPGEIIGLMILLAEGQMNFSVQALEDCETVVLPKKAMLELLSENKVFADVILTGIGERMKSLYDEIRQERVTIERENVPLFRTRIRDIMAKPSSVPEHASMLEAGKMMMHNDITSVTVLGTVGSFRGVLHMKDVMASLLSGQEMDQVAEWMNKDAVTVQEQAFSYEVLSYFKEDAIDLVPVLNGMELVGVTRPETFLYLEESKYLYMSHQLHKAESRDSLIRLGPAQNKDFLEFTELLLNERTYPREVCELISSYNDHIHRKAVEFALKEMEDEGKGAPPVNFCFIVMGSQGRREQAFSSDQDNGLILEDYRHLANHREVEEFFHFFAAKINQILADAGFPECTGGIMARERKWCRDYSEWVEEVHRWLKEADAEEIRDFTIFIDYRAVYGDFTLAENLREEITPAIQKNKPLHAFLMKDTIRFRVPINPLGRVSLRGKSKELDLKKSALMQIVNGIRIFAIRYGVESVNTTERLQELKRLEVLHPRDAKNAMMAMDYLLDARLRLNIRQLRDDEPLSNKIPFLHMDKDERKPIKDALIVAKRMQQMTELSFAKNRGI
ncbi:DUF294 nucleotidyltransferase-like domain-containing protein [Salisediminibacterium beveridgei]|uniref:Putative signal-transduction protein containing cAMP-binding and CBS domains n=1 Tax=Salisediminibacterium beveridgei TaxID=632773 RepID=A0A1D7QVK5_9BACI|nr:DUF294 nucleotidyltransferase-like domain-containing protein [Salisediminibacterium beveridgei]AOM83037.1 putative signal-transduction protein containing cAMP-binding and CBS domains [Salisediminibacterium beveridgei]